MPQDSSTIERLPEENVSIVETIEGKEDRPDSVRAITGSTRRKLYFNPAYFEPQLLLVCDLLEIGCEKVPLSLMKIYSFSGSASSRY